ncbi:MAG: hypothetical protein JNL54_13440 [Kineosporiaceae bacterium]|nr:hypothetical protein [Kineosporiaceae bacterium]
MSRSSRRILVPLVVVVVVVAALGGGWVWLRDLLDRVTLLPGCTATALGSTAVLDPEQAGNAAVIAAVAVRRGLPGRAATIGIATALQESKLRNIDYGDRDSLGLFQQRPSQGWGTADQIMDPVYATNAFYDVLVEIEGYQSLPITQAAQKVQRSAFPTAYASHETEARAFASSLSGYSPAALSCRLREPAELPAEQPGTGGLTGRARALAAAAAAETGRTGSAIESAEAPGTALRFTLTGSEPGRMSWALAQWAVARAQGLHVVAVEVDGRQWRRSQSKDGWTALDSGPEAGSVVVRVAAGG